MNELYADAPILVVERYELVNTRLLRNYRPPTFKRDVVWANYWLAKIEQQVRACKLHNKIS
jgi:hypothetical protein